MLIVPDADKLIVEAKINPQDIDQLRLGQKALLRFTAFNQRTTPEINGAVTRISADITDRSAHRREPTTPSASACRRTRSRGSARCRLVPGMPVEAFVQTGDRTVMSYLVKPLLDQLTRAFREK